MPGSPVAGTPFRTLRRLGSGGMSSVYAVEHTRTGERYALKVLASRLTNRPDCVARFELEAQALENLGHHPNLVALHDTGRLPDGRPFLVLRLLEGETLRQALRRGPPPVHYACSFVQQLLSALWAVHGAGVVHRDVKPDNLFVSPDGRCTLLDFGVIKVQPGGSLLTSPIVTEPGSIIGTAHYIAPEQAQSRATDARADLYAAGVVLAECLTGHVPLGDLSPDRYVRHIAERGFPSLDEVGALHVPPELRRVVRKATMQDPNERYASAEAFASALSWVALELGINVPGVQSGPWRVSRGRAAPATNSPHTPTTLDASPPLAPEMPSANAAGAQRLEAPPPAPAEGARSEAKTLASANSKHLRRRSPGRRAAAAGGHLGRRSRHEPSGAPKRPDGTAEAPQMPPEAPGVEAALSPSRRPPSPKAALTRHQAHPEALAQREATPAHGTARAFADVTATRASADAAVTRAFADVSAKRAVTVLWRDEPNEAGPPASLERDGVSSPKPKMGPPASDSASRISRLAAWGTLLFAMVIFATPRWRPRLVDSLVTIASPSLPEGWDTPASTVTRAREAHAGAPSLRQGFGPERAHVDASEAAPLVSDPSPADVADRPAPAPAQARPALRSEEGRAPSGSSGSSSPARVGAPRPHPFRAGLKPNY
ncbi:MAG: protein kinase [Polyangiaceae bacterium]|nr:protein kinase [Polyangiaceae bacterium]